MDWDATTLSDGRAVDGYYVTKTDPGTTTTAACGSSASSLITSATDCSDTSVPDGIYTYHVIAVFGSFTGTGNSPDEGTHVATETDTPSVNIGFPANGGTYGASSFDAGCATAGFCGFATDDNTPVSSGVHTVEVSVQQGSGNYWNGTSFGSATQTFVPATYDDTAISGDWSYAFDHTKLPAEGSYTVSAKATDWAGNVSTIASNTFTYDTTAPTATVTAAATPTNAQPVDFNVVFNEPVSDLAASGVTVGAPAADTGVSKSVTKTDSTHFTIHVNGLQTDHTGDGNITASVNAGAVTDVAGNASTASNTATAVYDTVAPTLSSMVMQDTNNNGKVDHVVATFNDNLQTTTATAPWTLTSAPGGATLLSVARGTGGNQNQVTLTLTEGTADTSVGSFKVALAASSLGVRDAAGNQASFGDTAPTDGAAPARISMQMQDQNGNGKVDAVVATYSEPIQDTTDASLWTFSGTVPSGGTKGAVTTSGSQVTIAITEGGGAVDTAVGSTFKLAYAAGSSGVKDNSPAANQAIAIAATAPSDGAAPIRTGLSAQDGNGDGRIDKVVATYSETLGTTTNAALWTFSGTTPGGGAKGTVSASGSAVTINITGASVDTTVPSDFMVAYTADSTGVKDASTNANQAASAAATAPSDAAPPIRTSMSMQDQNGDGKIDQVVANYSETIQSTTDAARWTLANVPSAGTKGAVSSSGSQVTIAVTPGAGAADTSTGTSPNFFTVAYTAASTGVTDAAGNQSPAVAATTPSDGAAPVRTGLVMQDATTNGKVDRIQATYSENIVNTSPDAALWSLGGTVPSGGTKGALTIAATSKIANLAITEGAGAADTTVGTLTVSYTAGATGIRDSAGNQAASFSGVAPSDGAGPVPTALTDTNGTTDGKFENTDTMTVTFSENITGVPTTSNVTLVNGGGSGNGSNATDGISASGLILATLANNTTGAADLGAKDYAAANVTFNTSTVSQSAGNNTFTLTLANSSATPGTTALGGTFTYFPAITLTDGSGNPAAGSLAKTTFKLF
ncbi:MAG: hypothetical protein ACJ77M_05755 [Thermoleophilaceae bacterium]